MRNLVLECLEFKKDKLNRDHYICMDVILKTQ